MAIPKSTLLTYYKRSDIQEAIVESAADLEVATKFDFGFSKRPDIFSYPNEVLQLAKKGATSFHFSEERWANPMMLGPTLKKKDMEDLRIGWDLVFDIDCPWWEFSKLSAKLILQALYDHGIHKSASIKFSGNKGFHIAVPFESFPKEINGIPTQRLFPEAARIVALYVVDYIEQKYSFKNNVVDFDGQKYSINDIMKITEKPYKDLVKKVCSKCNEKIKENEKKTVFVCSNCGTNYESDLDFLMCEKCNILTEKHVVSAKVKDDGVSCSCGKDSSPIERFNILTIVDVDTILISSRHLYRSVYSFNEKSGLVSAPFNPKKIDAFKKEFCKPENAKVSEFKFLDRSSAVEEESVELFSKAYHAHEKTLQKKVKKENRNQYIPNQVDEELLQEEIPKDLFPPCIAFGLAGLEDGKKRFMFLLTNFLSMTGYEYNRIEEELIEWNKVNPEPLRDTILLGQARYAKQHKKRVLPPNCDNQMYYKDLGICKPDNLCARTKNPVNYSKRKAKFLNHVKRKEKKQKETIETDGAKKSTSTKKTKESPTKSKKEDIIEKELTPEEK